MKWRPWTDAEVETARRLIDQKASDDECMAALGRSRMTCYQKLDRLRYSAAVARKQKTSTVALADADRRINAPRSITAWICGDPPPGFSALDRRRA